MDRRKFFASHKKNRPDHGSNYIDCVFDIREGETDSTLVPSQASQINGNNCTIYIDDVEIPFARTYTFDKAGLHYVTYKFNTRMTSLYRMLSGCNMKYVDANHFDATALTSTQQMCFGCDRLYIFDASEWVNDIGVNMNTMFGWTPFERVAIGRVKVTNLDSFAANNRNALLDRDYTVVDMHECYGSIESWGRCFRRQLGSSFMRRCDVGQINLIGSKKEIFSWGERESLVEFRVGGLYKDNIDEFSWYTKLSIDSLLSILNALPQLDEGETYTCTFGSEVLEKLTEEQKQIATSKGWVLA